MRQRHIVHSYLHSSRITKARIKYCIRRSSHLRPTMSAVNICSKAARVARQVARPAVRTYATAKSPFGTPAVNPFVDNNIDV